MAGERDLKRLLASLQPQLAEEPYIFAALPPQEAIALAGAAWAMVRETEATTLILPLAAAPEAFASAPHWARITLQVHSSLEAVGMIAAVATALAQHDISTNPVAGYYHDHLFVPWERRADALHILQTAF